MNRWTCPAWIALGLIASVARADAIGPPPSSCPPGGVPMSCHGGPYCSPETCASDADCAPGTLCRDVSVCVGSVVCAGLVGPGEDLEQYRRFAVEGTCGQGDCSGSRCTVRPLCVPADRAPDGGVLPRGGTGARPVPPQPIGGGGGGGGAMRGNCTVQTGGRGAPCAPGAVLGLAAIALARRARRER